jgi:steroid 5-alpha reductase family enzyme
MAFAWQIQQQGGNSTWIDVSWSAGVGCAAVVAALAPLEPGWPRRRQAAVAALAAAWCFRLALHLARRARTGADDPRYRALREQWGAAAPRRMFLFPQTQAVVGVTLVLAVALAARNPDPSFRVQDVVGLAVLVIGVIGEAIADRQLRAFSDARAKSGLICDIGLWSWSRHPNYFFEWLSWAAYPIVAIDLDGHSPLGWISLAAPILMYWALVHASGIPPLEAHMLRSRGHAFREYRRRTSPFFPMPPKR